MFVVADPRSMQLVCENKAWHKPNTMFGDMNIPCGAVVKRCWRIRAWCNAFTCIIILVLSLLSKNRRRMTLTTHCGRKKKNQRQCRNSKHQCANETLNHEPLALSKSRWIKIAMWSSHYQVWKLHGMIPNWTFRFIDFDPWFVKTTSEIRQKATTSAAQMDDRAWRANQVA